MIVEHVFVTTLKPAEVFDLSLQFLSHFGFIIEAPPSASDSEHKSLHFSRGTKNPRRNAPMNKWKQRITLEYDRGRITVAASIMSPLAGHWTTQSGDIPRAYYDPAKEYLFQIARALEKLLAHNGSPDKALADLTEFEQILVSEHGQRSNRRTIMVIVIIGVFILAMIIMVMALIASVH